MTYEFLAKEIQRSSVVACHRWSTDPKPILYLDGERGEATTSFLRHGVAKKCLLPVNQDPTVVATILETSGVKGLCGDIDEIVTQSDDDAYSVVWLDYTCRHTQNHVCAYKESLRSAPCVSVTHSSRGVDRDALFDSLIPSLKRLGRLIERPHPYKGKSDVENMLRFTLVRHSNEADDESETSETTETSDETTDEIDVGTKLLVDHRGTWLTAVCQDTNETEVHVRFDYDGVWRWMPRSKVQPNTEVTDATSSIGTDVAVPVCLWKETKPRGYDDVKRIRKRLYFRVGAPYRRSRTRFKVYAIWKDGEISTRAENFTVTSEEIQCWRSV